jgi:hypothetical protein
MNFRILNNICKSFVTKRKVIKDSDIKIIKLNKNELKHFQKANEEFIHTNKTNTEIVLNKLFSEKDYKKEMAEVDFLYKTLEQDELKALNSSKSKSQTIVIDKKVNKNKEIIDEKPKSKIEQQKIEKKNFEPKKLKENEQNFKQIENKMKNRENLKKSIDEDEKEVFDKGFDIATHLKSVKINHFENEFRSNFICENIDKFCNKVNTAKNKQLIMNKNMVSDQKLLEQFKFIKENNFYNVYLFNQKFVSFNQKILLKIQNLIKQKNPKIISQIFHIKRLQINKKIIFMLYLISDKEHILTIALNLSNNVRDLSLNSFQVFFLFFLCNFIAKNNKAKFKLVTSRKFLFDRVLFTTSKSIFHKLLSNVSKEFMKKINNTKQSDLMPNLSYYEQRTNLNDFAKTFKQVSTIKDNEMLILF